MTWGGDVASTNDTIIPAGKLRVEITHLEMKRRPNSMPVNPAAADVLVARARDPSVTFYRFLYNTVGEPWLWGGRRLMPDRELAAHIGNPRVDIHVLYLAGEPAGFAELDRRAEDDVELSYFGIMPEHIGRKLGPYLLGYAIGEAWRAAPRRLRVQTCSLDHPAALPLYQRFGFVPTRQVVEIWDDPRVQGVIPRDAAPQHPIVT